VTYILPEPVAAPGEIGEQWQVVGQASSLPKPLIFRVIPSLLLLWPAGSLPHYILQGSVELELQQNTPESDRCFPFWPVKALAQTRLFAYTDRWPASARRDIC
jgi:hypothetical protein